MKQFETKHFVVVRAGLSSDMRTNRWEVQCKECNYKFEPATTMFRFHELECDKCGTTEVVDYNTIHKDE